MNDIEAKISALLRWGADPNKAIRRILGDEDLYFNLLHGFAGSSDWDVLTDLIGQRAFKDAFVIVHRMKGSAADLELTPLFDSLCFVTEDLRNEVRPSIYDDLKGLLLIRNSLIDVLGIKAT